MDKQNPKNRNILYAAMLAIGIAGLIFNKVLNVEWGEGVVTVVWLITFLWLACEYREKYRRVITGLFFCLGFYIKYMGATGILWMSLLLFIAAAAVFYGIILIYAYIISRWKRLITTLALPLLWLILYMLATLLRFPSIFRVDMMFTNMNEFVQVESLIGSAGLSFVVMWIIALIQYTINNHSIKAGFTAGVLVTIIMSVGIVQLFDNYVYKESVKVAYTTGCYVGDFINYKTVSVDECIESMEKSADKAAEKGASILAFNEEAYEIKDVEADKFIKACKAKAREHDMHILMGMDIEDTDGSEGGKSLNKIIWIDQNGNVTGSYLKAKTLPVIEGNYRPGPAVIPSNTIEVDGRSINVSYLICYDSNFPEYVKKMNRDTDIFFLPSWDWSAVTQIHSHLSRTIAVENRVSVVKPTYDGKSMVVDPMGKVIKSTSTDDFGYENVQVADVPIKSGGVMTVPKETDPFNYALIAAELISIMVCLVLLFGTCFENREATDRRKYYFLLILTCMIALAADAISWILDGCENLESTLQLSTTVSILLPGWMAVEFVAFIMAFIKERRDVSTAPVKWIAVYTACLTLFYLIGSITEGLFTFDHGVYVAGSLYGIYVATSTVSSLASLAVVIIYRKVLGLHDSIAAYTYVAIPTICVGVNIFVDDFSFFFPATTVSLALVYVMMQSEKVGALRTEGIRSSYDANHDKLTDMGNRRAYDNKLQKIRTSDENVGVIFADVNSLKYTNDHYGHAAGDKLIVELSRLLDHYYMKEEIYRISGDEFVVLMEKVPQALFEDRNRQLEEMLENGEKTIASAGTAYGNCRNVNSLIMTAEAEMYKKKESFYEKYPRMKRK